jgi:hypothetical protein
MRRSGFYTGDGGVFSADKTGDRFMSHMKNQMMGRLSDRRQKFIGKGNRKRNRKTNDKKTTCA